jgi:hypothetical protein
MPGIDGRSFRATRREHHKRRKRTDPHAQFLVGIGGMGHGAVPEEQQSQHHERA